MAPSSQHGPGDPFAFLAGSEMGASIRAFDWARTPLGPIATWPRSLTTAVQVMLDSRFPMFVWWGGELINLYNDAYVPVLGKRHPQALGRPASEIWWDVWPIVGPQAEVVLKEGRATWNEEQLLLMERNRFLEETYFTFSYSPIRDEAGAVSGLFCACTEDTQRVLVIRRLAAFRALVENANRAKTAETACAAAAAVLTGSRNDVPFSLIYLLDDDTRVARLAGLTTLKRGGPTSPLVVDLDEADAPWPFRQVAETNNPMVLELNGRSALLPSGAWPDSARHAFVMPLSQPDSIRPSGFFVAGISPRLPFDDDYRAFLSLLASKISTAIDITKRMQTEKALRESEERFRSMANTTPAMIWTADPSGTITFHNQRWLEYIGHSTEESVEDWPGIALHPDDRERCIKAWKRALAEGSDYAIEARNRRHDGEYRWFLTQATPIRDAEGRVVEWYGSTTDIHDRKVAEEELQDVNRRKDQFLATLAHELRNPLAPLRSGLQLMKLASNDPEVVEQARGVMERQLGQMVHLIDDLLDLSRINRGKVNLHKERMPLEMAVKQAVEASRPLISLSGHELAVTMPDEALQVHADPTRVTQVLSNLLNNAAKFTPAGGHVRLTVRRQADEAVISVRDDGIGIPAHMLGRIFDMFTQVDRHRSEGGLGIGLSLVKALVEMHDGAVEAHSAGPGEGSEFVVRLPLANSQSEEQHAPEVKAPRPVSRRILVADDNRDAAIAMGKILTIKGNEVRTAHDGQEAVDVAADFRPEVILLDIGMPKMNGYDACRHIRAQAWSLGMVLIAVTGWGQEGDRARSREAGFDFHLVKPVDIATLDGLLAGLRTGAAPGSASLRKPTTEGVQRAPKQERAVGEEAG